jgi:hypothetical protein
MVPMVCVIPLSAGMLLQIPLKPFAGHIIMMD